MKILKQVPAANRSERLPIDIRVDELHAIRRTLTDAIVGLEKKGARPRAPAAGGSEIELRALQLLAGLDQKSFDLESPTKADVNSRLWELYRECEAVDRALVIGAQHSIRDHADRLAETMRERGNEWRELVYQTAMAVLALRKLNQRRRQFISEVSSGGVVPSLPCMGPAQHLLGIAGQNASDEASRFLSDAIKAGIITPREVSDA
jgi:hypothetical protein